MNLTRREFLKLGGAAAISLSFAEGSFANAVNIPVLMYHDISHQVSDPETVVPPRLAAQMEWLFSAGYRTIFFREIDTLDAERAKRAVIITFDDGFASFMDYALPLFQNYGFKSTINIIGNCVGGFVSGNDPRLSWDECRYLARTGLVEIGCHTYGLHSWYGNQSRPNAVTVFNTKLEQDLAVFQEVYAREMGHPATILAWPYGMHDEKSIELARQAGFSSILNSEYGYFEKRNRRYDIPRLPVGHAVDLKLFREMIEMRS